jgi:hypothetical protein
MSLYKGSAAVEGGGSFEPGPYKFKVTEASLADWAILYELQTWDASGKEGPKIKDALRIHSDSKAMKEEIDRRLTTLLGKPEIDSADELVGKAGWLILRKGHKYLEPMPFGGYFDKDKKSATGNSESILSRGTEALEYDWKQDSYAVAKAQKAGIAAPVGEDDTQPF